LQANGVHDPINVAIMRSFFRERTSYQWIKKIEAI